MRTMKRQRRMGRVGTVRKTKTEGVQEPMRSTPYYVDGTIHSGKIAFLIILICNLSFSPFYSSAFAQEGEGGDIEVTACPALPSDVPQEVKDYFEDYQPVHEQIFTTPYTWCSASGWLLDEDVSEVVDPWTPTPVTGSIFGGEIFWAEVYEVRRIDWETLGLPPDTIQIAEETDFEFRLVGMIVHGDAGDLPVWGFTYTITFTGTAAHTRQTIFLFAKQAPVMPPVEQVGIQGQQEDCTGYPEGSRERCLCFARANHSLCKDAAFSNSLLGLGDDLTGFLISLLACIVAYSYLTSPLLIALACAIPVLIMLKCLVFGIAAYLNAKNICDSQFALDQLACPSQ